MLSTLERLFKEWIEELLGIRKRKPPSPSETPSPSPPPAKEPTKTHPWRICPVGEHWVREHIMTIPPSSKGPEYPTTRKGHCRRNRSGKEIYTADELLEIASRHFPSITNNPDFMPIPNTLGYPDGNRYDLSIAGWTLFWNETLQPKTPLSPDLVKALIASESSFKILPDTPSNIGAARGLIQITEQTRKILQDTRGELRDHLIDLSVEKSRDPECNIATGIRWLHHKKDLLEKRIKREATWEEAVAEYKGITSQLGKNKTADRIMSELNHKFNILKTQRIREKP